MMIKAIKHLAQSLGITQPRLSDLKRGHISLFSLDTLLNLATSAVVLAPRAQVRSTPIKTKLNPVTKPRSTSPRLAVVKHTKRRVVA